MGEWGLWCTPPGALTTQISTFQLDELQMQTTSDTYRHTNKQTIHGCKCKLLGTLTNKQTIHGFKENTFLWFKVELNMDRSQQTQRVKNVD